MKIYASIEEMRSIRQYVYNKYKTVCKNKHWPSHETVQESREKKVNLHTNTHNTHLCKTRSICQLIFIKFNQFQMIESLLAINRW